MAEKYTQDPSSGGYPPAGGNIYPPITTGAGGYPPQGPPIMQQATQEVVVMTQPRSIGQMQNQSDWNEGLCGCMSDVGNCEFYFNVKSPIITPSDAVFTHVCVF